MGNQRARPRDRTRLGDDPRSSSSTSTRSGPRFWALRDNNHYAEWDEQALAELLAELAAGDVDLLLTGFANRDIDRILAGIQKPVDPDDAPPAPARAALQAGRDLRTRRRTGCSAAMRPTPPSSPRLVQSEKAEVLWTDPPYGVDYVGKTADALRIENDQPDQLPELLRDAFAAADRARPRRGSTSPPRPGRSDRVPARAREVGWQLHQASSG